MGFRRFMLISQHFHVFWRHFLKIFKNTYKSCAIQASHLLHRGPQQRLPIPFFHEICLSKITETSKNGVYKIFFEKFANLKLTENVCDCHSLDAAPAPVAAPEA